MVSEASEAVANRFIAAIEARFEPFRHFPLLGPARPLLAPGLRATFQQPYVVYYVPTSEEVVIVRVLHGARDIEAVAERGGFR